MRKLTKKQFLQNCRHPQLAKAVFRQLGASWKEIINFPYDFRTPTNGIAGFTYYNETEPFAKRHIELILKAVSDFQSFTGGNLFANKYAKDNMLNFLAWFALETVIDDIIYFLEQ